jgi:hypothetical protein
VLDLQGYVSTKNYVGIMKSHVSVCSTLLKVSVVTVSIVNSEISFVLQVWLNRLIYSCVSAMTNASSCVRLDSVLLCGWCIYVII